MDAWEYIYREVFPTFLAKKSYDWWITRRRMEIYTKISKRKRVGKNIQFSHVAVPISYFGFRCAKFPHFGLRNSHLDFHRAKLSLSLMQLSSEGHIFLISASNRTWFEPLDS